MNNRYTRMNELLKEWKKEGKQDKNIMKALFAQVNLENNEMVNNKEDLKQNTMYSSMSDEDFFELFEKDSFNEMDTNKIKHLIQEAHNRFIKANNVDVTRNVVVKNDKENDGVFGYVCSEDNMLFINNYMIERAKNTSPERDTLNRDNVGKVFWFINNHESQHVVQFENSINLALKEEQTEDQKFSGAITAINNANFFIADDKKDQFYFQKWQAMYDYHFVEHEANYTATKTVNNKMKEENKHSLAYYQYMAETCLLGLRYRPSLTESSHGKIKTRVQKIENYIKDQLDYFEKGAEDCSLKNDIIKTVKDYMKVDEKGHSKLRDRLTKEITYLDINFVDSMISISDLRRKQNNGKKFDRNEDIFGVGLTMKI